MKLNPCATFIGTTQRPLHAEQQLIQRYRNVERRLRRKKLRPLCGPRAQQGNMPNGLRPSSSMGEKAKGKTCKAMEGLVLNKAAKKSHQRIYERGIKDASPHPASQRASIMKLRDMLACVQYATRRGEDGRRTLLSRPPSQKKRKPTRR